MSSLRYTARYMLAYWAFMLRHPLNRGRPVRTIARYLAWHIGSRVLRRQFEYPFANDLRVRVGTGMWGLTGVIYFGLEEYEDMAFCAHLLRPDDLFVDVGACFGTYSLLAAGVSGSRVMAFEPIAGNAAHFGENLKLNHLQDKVDVRVRAVGASVSTVMITARLNAANHVVSGGDAAEAATPVPLTTLDHELAGEHPVLLKIDVEGYEQAVLDGARSVLALPTLLGVIMEDVNLGVRYGTGQSPHDTLLGMGFQSYRYTPEQRALSSLNGQKNREGLNTLYLRDVEKVRARLEAAEKFSVRGYEI